MFLKYITQKFLHKVGRHLGVNEIADLLRHLILISDTNFERNVLLKGGAFGFSQNYEDTILRNIFARLNLENGKFVEFGVGDGTENNSILLLAAGWSGNWFGAEDLCFDPSTSSRLQFKKVWVTLENIWELYCEAGSKVDLISMDLDGNDIHLCERLLSHGARPSVFVVEYNSKFPPPIKFSIEYNSRHVWLGDDFYGASLMSYICVFQTYGYQLVCCDPTGVNAFFIRNEFTTLFDDISKDPFDLYVGPNFALMPRKLHRVSTKTMERIISN